MIKLMFPVLAFALLVVFIFFALRQGTKVKPDKDRRTKDGPRITEGGSQ